MSAPTTALRWRLARAAVRTTGLLHIVSERDSGALNPVCGANPIRSTNIETPATLTDVALLCPACSAIAVNIGGTVADGVAFFLRRRTGAGSVLLLDVALDRILPAASRTGSDEALADLVESVALHGVLQPVVLRRTDAGLEIVSGRRRIAAAVLAGHATVPALVREISDATAVIATLTENLHRADLNPIEQAQAFARALEQLDCNQKGLATRLAVSPPVISNALRLLTLPQVVQQQLVDGTLSAAHGRALLRLADPIEQTALAAEWASEGTSTRDAEQAAKDRAAVPTRPAAVPLPDVAALLTSLLDVARVRATSNRITIDVADDVEMRRVLERLGAATPAGLLAAA